MSKVLYTNFIAEIASVRSLLPMNKQAFHVNPQTLYLIYDGDCLICSHTAKATRLRVSVKRFELINARDAHSLITIANNKGLNLNEGIVIFYQNQIWSGENALHYLALIVTPVDLLNRTTAFLFRRRWISCLFYPLLKFLRKLLLILRNKKNIPYPLANHVLQAIEASVHENLPPVFQKRYHIRFFSKQNITLHGVLDIIFSKSYRYVLPFFRLAGALVCQEGSNIKTTVQCISAPGRLGFVMARRFHFPDQQDQLFESEIRPLSSKHWVEVTNRFFAWRFKYQYKHQTLSMHHQGYGLMIRKRYWPVPGASLLLGKPYGEETAVTDNRFRMKVRVVHWLFKCLVSYEGVFDIET